MSKTRIIKVDSLARVEGEGALAVRIRDGKLEDVKFRIYEPPRFFEAFLKGRAYSDAPDITARICGICPMAYLIGASQAMEDALGIRLDGPLRALRRMAYCGEWIESHVLHAYMLHAPDFTGHQDALTLAKVHPETVQMGLRLKKLGNEILEVIGGRAIHPVNFSVGGFFKAPRKAAFKNLIEELKWGVEAAEKTVQFFSTLNFPDYEYDYHCVALRHEDEYAITEGRIVSNRGLDLPVSDFNVHFEEEHVAHSNALQGRTKLGEPYLVGPIARFNLNFDKLTPRAQAAAKKAGLNGVCKNPFKSLLVRSIETLYACEEALRIAENYVEPDASAIKFDVKAGVGHGCTEAPRGICYHRYKIDEAGLIEEAQIVPPTAQNQKQIERDLWGVVEKNMDLDEEALKWRCEQTIRNYDPCISCATHFLKLTVDRQ